MIFRTGLAALKEGVNKSDHFSEKNCLMVVRSSGVNRGEERKRVSISIPADTTVGPTVAEDPRTGRGTVVGIDKAEEEVEGDGSAFNSFCKGVNICRAAVAAASLTEVATSVCRALLSLLSILLIPLLLRVAVDKFVCRTLLSVVIAISAFTIRDIEDSESTGRELTSWCKK